MAERFPWTRRHLLTLGGSLLAGACTPSRPQEGTLGTLEHVTERVQRLLFDATRLADDPGTGALTPDGAFPAYKVGDQFPVVPGTWRLRIGGLVAHPVDLSLEDLHRLTRTDVRYRHHCVEGWSAVAGWHGVRLSEVARLVGADPHAAYVRFQSFETDARGVGYSSSWDRASALHPQTLLAFGRNGQALGQAYGGPVRLYASVKLGYKMVKWLNGVDFLATRTGGYWEDQGYEWWAGV